MIEPIVEAKYSKNQGICLVHGQVTFAALHKVKFYLDFSTGLDPEIVSNLEYEASSIISKLKTSLLTCKDIIENVTYDINRVDEVIYFDIFLGPSTTQTSFIELLSHLSFYLKF